MKTNKIIKIGITLAICCTAPQLSFAMTPRPTCECSSNLDCDTGFVCDGCWCEAQEVECDTASDCSKGELCVDHQCVYSGEEILYCDSVDDCSEDIADPIWFPGFASDGREHSQVIACVEHLCTEITQYRCPDGYYGAAQTAGSCELCPTSGGIAGSSVAGQNYSISGCFMPSGTDFADESGSGIFTANCYHSPGDEDIEQEEEEIGEPDEGGEEEEEIGG